jgi:hypothetical protein
VKLHGFVTQILKCIVENLLVWRGSEFIIEPADCQSAKQSRRGGTSLRYELHGASAARKFLVTLMGVV